jgi:hypothetical protein
MYNKALVVQWLSACTDMMFIGSGFEALGSIPYKCRYNILLYFNFPFN